MTWHIVTTLVGDKYGPEYARRWAKGVVKHWPWDREPDAEITVYTDKVIDGMPDRARVAPLLADETTCPIWWSKVPLWSPRMPIGRYLWSDLDNIHVRDLSPLLACPWHLAVSCDWARWQPGLGLVVYDMGALAGAYVHYMNDPAGVRAAVGRDVPGGCDQALMAALMPNIPAIPRGLYLDYKRDLDSGKRPLPADCCIVTFAGRPKPHKFHIGPASGQMHEAPEWMVEWLST